MKYGLLYYKDTANIGDDIQTYAASQFLPRVDYMIDRENIEKFVPNEKEYVSVIMNAWYIHDGFNFNFSPYINPLFISMFFKYFEPYAGTTLGLDYINKSVVREQLLKYSPVGTRDLHTKKIMDKLNIPNYFSGCMTLTLNKFSDVKKADYIVAVGLKEEEIEYIKKNTNREVINVIQNIPKGSLSNLSWEERKKKVEKILKIYQGAHMVITTKLHCSLPCLALGTPVLLLYDTSVKENKERIGTYIEYLNYIDRRKFLKSKIDFDNPIKNPKKHLKLRNDLINRCNQFINDSKNVKLNDNLIDPKIYISIINDQREIRNVIIKHFNILTDKYIKECIKSNKYKEELIEYKYKSNELQERLYNIINSKGWKFLEKIRKIKRKLLRK